MLTASLFARNQIAILLISAFIIVESSSKSSPDCYEKVSSANINVRSSVTLYRSLMKHRNKMGPSTLPCKTEIFSFLDLDILPFISTIMTFYPSRILDPGAKKAPDPVSQILICNTESNYLWRYGTQCMKSRMKTLSEFQFTCRCKPIPSSQGGGWEYKFSIEGVS